MGEKKGNIRALVKPIIALVLIFLVVSNLLLFIFPVPDKGSGIERFFTAPIKLIEYRRSSSEPPWNISKYLEGNQAPKNLEKPPYPVPSARELENDLRDPVVEKFVGELINESIARISARKLLNTPDLVRGTAYSLMLERVKYVHHGKINVPSYTIQNGGVCSDWTLVAYALVRKINDMYNITAEYYFLTIDPKWDVGHAFLAVHYPSDDHWEAFDWFATSYLQMPLGDNGEFRFMKVGEGIYVFGWFPIGVSETVHFNSLDEMLTVYSLGGGYLEEGYKVTLYRLPHFIKARQISIFTLTDQGKLKLQELNSKFRSRKYLNKFQKLTLRVKRSGGGRAEIIDMELTRDFLILDVKLEGISSPLEIRGDGTKVALLNTEGVKILKWEGVSYVGQYPIYERLVVSGNTEELKLGLLTLESGSLPIFVSVSITEVVGGNGVTLEIW